METASDVGSTTDAATTGNEAPTSTDGACGNLVSEGSYALAGGDACASIGWGTLTRAELVMRTPSAGGSESKNTASASTAADGSIAAPGAISDERSIGDFLGIGARTSTRQWGSGCRTRRLLLWQLVIQEGKRL